MIEVARHSKYIKIKPKEYKEWAAWVLYGKQYNYAQDLPLVTKMIQSHLDIKLCPPKFRENNLGNPMFGHCYHSTQALYFFFKDANLRAMSAPCDVAGSHWWLVDDNNTIIDITDDQYLSVGKTPPYDKGKETSWYGWRNRTHRKTLTLMNNVQPDSKLVFEKYFNKPVKSY
jgi:hypothetical protein